MQTSYAAEVHQTEIYPVETHYVGLSDPRMVVDIDGQRAGRDYIIAVA